MLEMEIQFKICRKNRISAKKKIFFFNKKVGENKNTKQIKEKKKEANL